MPPLVKGRTLNINLYAGPGFGKSVTAAMLYGNLKLRGIHTELVSEYAKELVYLDRLKGVSQHEIMTEQLRRQGLLQGKAAVVVTDAPTPMSLVYALRLGVPRDELEALYALQARGSQGWHNMDVLLHRDITKDYESEGREQTPEQSLAMHSAITDFVREHSSALIELQVEEALAHLTDLVLERLSQAGVRPRDSLVGA